MARVGLVFRHGRSETHYRQNRNVKQLVIKTYQEDVQARNLS